MNNCRSMYFVNGFEKNVKRQKLQGTEISAVRNFERSCSKCTMSSKAGKNNFKIEQIFFYIIKKA